MLSPLGLDESSRDGVMAICYVHRLYGYNGCHHYVCSSFAFAVRRRACLRPETRMLESFLVGWVSAFLRVYIKFAEVPGRDEGEVAKCTLSVCYFATPIMKKKKMVHTSK